jgi:hypothetical protein
MDEIPENASLSCGGVHLSTRRHPWDPVNLAGYAWDGPRHSYFEYGTRPTGTCAEKWNMPLDSIVGGILFME